MGEFGVYDVNVSNKCIITTMVEPVNENLPLLYCTLILILLGFVFHITKWSVKKRYTAKLERLYKLAKRQVGYEVSPSV